MSNVSFKFMSFYFRIRDFSSSPSKILELIGIRPGSYVLDYGCGSGSYSIPLAEIVGPTGRVYAADIHTLAIREVQKRANMRRHGNIQTILTDSYTQLPGESIDVVFLFYVLHDFENPDIIIKDLDRVLKPAGRLVVMDHKFDNEKIVSLIGQSAEDLKLTKTGLRNESRKRTMLVFSKVK